MSDKLRVPQSFVRILFILIIFLIAYLVVGFVRQVSVSQQRKEELGRLDEAVATALVEQAELGEAHDYALSTAAVEQWAAENGWSRPDEVAIVIVDTLDSGFAGNREPQGSDMGEDAPRTAWWDLFFGNR